MYPIIKSTDRVGVIIKDSDPAKDVDGVTRLKFCREMREAQREGRPLFLISRRAGKSTGSPAQDLTTPKAGTDR